MGRPTKVEGNPDHPASLGATDVFAPGGDPARPLRPRPLAGRPARRPRSAPGTTSSPTAIDALDAQRPRKGARAPDPDRDGHLADARPARSRRLLEEFPEASWHQYEPVDRDNARAGAQLAFGERRRRRATTSTRPTSSSRSTPTSSPRAPATCATPAQFADRRREPGDGAMNRLYAVERTPTITGAMADHRLPLRPREVAGVRRGHRRASSGSSGPRTPTAPLERHAPLGRRAGRATCRRTRGKSLVVAGEAQPAAVHALAHAINEALGNVGETVDYTEPVEAEPVDQVGVARASWSRDMDAGAVDMLADPRRQPGLHRPGRPRLRRGRSRKVRAARSTWASTRTRPRRSAAGTSPRRTPRDLGRRPRPSTAPPRSIQPLIAPLYGGRSAHELLAALLGQPEPAGLRDRPRAPGRTQRRRRRLRDVLADGASTTASSPSTAADAEAGHAQARARPARRRARRRGRRARDRLPARPDDLGRPVRQQRLAPGTAQAADQADLGQRRLHQPGDRRAAGPDQRATWSS